MYKNKYRVPSLVYNLPWGLFKEAVLMYINASLCRS